MFGDLLGNVQAQQEQLQNKLKGIKINHDQNGISIELNAAKEILNISIDESFFQTERQEELQDLLIVSLNRAIQKAEDVQANESSSMINDLLPGGLGGMFGQ